MRRKKFMKGYLGIVKVEKNFAFKTMPVRQKRKKAAYFDA